MIVSDFLVSTFLQVSYLSLVMVTSARDVPGRDPEERNRFLTLREPTKVGNSLYRRTTGQPPE